MARGLTRAAVRAVLSEKLRLGDAADRMCEGAERLWVLRGTTTVESAPGDNWRGCYPQEAWSKEWCVRVVEYPIRSERQELNRFRFWAAVPEFGDKVLRVITLEDKVTIHNAFPDRGFKP